MAKNEKLKAFFDSIAKIDETLLDESVVKQIENIFDDAVKSKVDEIAKSLDESIDLAAKSTIENLKNDFDKAVLAKADELAKEAKKDLNESLQEEIKDLTVKLDESLDHAIDKFMRENKIAMMAEVEVEKAKALDESINDLIKTFKIKTDPKAIDESKMLDDAIKVAAQAKKELKELKREMIINDLTKELTVAGRESVMNLSESIEFDLSNEDEFKDKIKNIVDVFVAKVDSEKKLNESKGDKQENKKPASRDWEF